MGINEPDIREGGLAVDDRGCIRFINDFHFTNIKRFYQIRNHRAGFVRAWHGHCNEVKYVYVPKGAAVVKAVSFAEVEKYRTTWRSRGGRWARSRKFFTFLVHIIMGS